MHGSSDAPDGDPRIQSIETRLSQLETRIVAIEAQLTAFAERQFDDHKQLKRLFDMKTARTGELSSRIAQRIAKLEAAVDVLARTDEAEPVDRA